MSATACLLKNELASLCVLRMAKGDEPGAEAKASVNSANVVLRTEIPNHKTQVPNNLKITKSKYQNEYFELWNLLVYLKFGAWSLEFPRGARR